MSDVTLHFAYCDNCGIRLTGRFCANCGQKAQKPMMFLLLPLSRCSGLGSRTRVRSQE